MLDYERKSKFSKILESAADSLDIPESKYKDAEERYRAVGEWLGKDDSPLAPFKPEIYTQGSFRLGTVVKPITMDDEYDIDLVCELDLTEYDVTQQQLKRMVGDRLKANETYAKMLDKEGRRCWTLNYSESAKFHMDILPAIPDNYQWLINLGVPLGLANNAICITDNKNWNIDPVWPRSNPKGYSEWFHSRMQLIFDAQKKIIAKQLRANIEDIPDCRVKTPLQRAVQILKRHRDIIFEHDPDDKPISIIISTLAAKAYNDESDLFDALNSITIGMPNYIEKKDNQPWIPNPVNPNENFADKWKEHPQREKKFRKWLENVRLDLLSALLEQQEYKMSDAIESRLRIRAPSSLPAKSKLSKNMRVPSLFNVSHRQGLKWPVQNTWRVSVEALATRSGFRSIKYKNNSEPLLKHYSIRFEAKTNVPSPYEVYWQVVNTGEEAKEASCLRGGFYKSSLIHRESTLYTGTHWIECFIVKNGICVARSREFIVNIR